MTDVELFTGYESVAPAAVADRLFTAWRNTPDCRPLLPSTRVETIKKRIREAVEGGFDQECIFGALNNCWKWTSQRAWATALDISAREQRRQREPRLSETQTAILERLGGTATN
jgi:hypothetical protein